MNCEIKIGDILEYKWEVGSRISEILYIKSVDKYDRYIRGLVISYAKNKKSEAWTASWEKDIVEKYIKTGRIVLHKRKPNDC